MNIQDYRPNFIRVMPAQEQPKDFTKRKCLQCKTDLPQYVKYYCSGSCMQAAKDEGTYVN